MLKTGHRTKYHLRAFEFLAARRRSRAVLTCTLLASFLATMPTGGLQAGDILRGGASAGNAKRNSEARANAGAAAAEAAKVRAQDRLARTTKAVNDMRALQASARAAGANTAFNGLYHPTANPSGGLRLLARDGADAPTASGNNVNIKQTASQALLNWQTFDVGSQTTVNFDQSAGGVDASKWIAFNKVSDPTGKPSEIRGKINAQGQVYIINQNGIIFGASSQVNARTLVASALPINDNLIKSGLLNNKDAQFLFSGLDVPGGSDGTPSFNPIPLPAGVRYGDVVVERGALLETPASADGNGGRVMLVGANVRNEGTISTPAGQSILAAGLQVGIQAHDNEDPSLRGLDVWVGSVGDYAGIVTNSGVVNSPTGSITAVGKTIQQNGVLDSTTSVSLNGRIDLLANYGAVANPNFDNTSGTGAGGPMFLNQFTGVISISGSSTTRLLPDYASTKKVPGSTLPENSQIKFQGRDILFFGAATLVAPGADVSISSGVWPYTDVADNRTIFKADGTNVEDGLTTNFTGKIQRFLFSGGQVFFDSGSLLDVSGSTDVFVPLDQNILTVQFRGSELADSPIQRDSTLRGQKLVVDIRKSGQYGGRYWLGSPLGDLTGLAGIIERDVAQLTTKGGSIAIQSGGLITMQPGSTLDVSGGYFRNEGGSIQTSKLLRQGNIIDISNATPDKTYDGVYDGTSSFSSSKWGITNTFNHPLSPFSSVKQHDYIEGADSGRIQLSAPTILAGGDLMGRTITGSKQLNTPASQASLSLNFKAEARYAYTSSDIRFYETSPLPPSVTFSNQKPSVSGFVLADDESLPSSLTSTFTISSTWWDEEGGGIGNISIDNKDGALVLARGTSLVLHPGGSFTARASNVEFAGSITAPGGSIAITAYNYSPYVIQELTAKSPSKEPFPNQPAPGIMAGRGYFSLLSGGKIDVSGMLVNERTTAIEAFAGKRNLNGGSFSVEAYGVTLEKDSSISASGGVLAKTIKGFQYGSAGSITLLAGVDPGLSSSFGGQLALDGKLEAYGVKSGGSLTLRSSLVQIGGKSQVSEMLLLQPDFFQSGGFTSYSVAGIGKKVGSEFIPAVKLAAGTILEPRSEHFLISPTIASKGSLQVYSALLPIGERKPTNLKFTATGADDPFTTTLLEARGDIVLEQGSKIKTDPGASVLIGTDTTLSQKISDTVTVLGEIEAPGGTVAIFSKGRFRLAPDLDATSGALPTIYIGSDAKISTAGTFVKTPDSYGRHTGIIYPGGKISVYGNILAESGASLDVSGASALVDLHPSLLKAATKSTASPKSGLNTIPNILRTVPKKLDSDGGQISLHGSEMLFSDASLVGRAGGKSAIGGSLSIFSGRAYAPADTRTGADINLVVTQSSNVLPTGIARGIGVSVKDATNVEIPSMGYFTADQFQKGGFYSLDLGYKYISTSPISYGGNVQFNGPVSISAPGKLRIAAGGIIKADSTVNLSATYISFGQQRRAPANPEDSAFTPFEQYVPPSSSPYFPPPSYGSGVVSVSANLIDIGTTVFQNTKKVELTAANGDVRGDGTLSVAGDVTITAGQIYPDTLGTFNIFAYDHGGLKSTISVIGSGSRPTPYSAGGNINLFASHIIQGGVLRAPFGTITLGWDGLDTDPSTPALDKPSNPIVGSTLATPETQSITLSPTSITSVSAWDSITGQELLIPFGLSPDGLSWVDPRGVNVTVAGLPEKRISMGAGTINFQKGAMVDIRGGGELLGYRWISGIGGTQDILGEPNGEWSAGTDYSAGDLVSYGGKTWSARVAIAAKNFASVPKPEPGLYWSQVEDSYAVLPGYQFDYAPYASFNTGTNAKSLGGDPGFASSKIGVGDQVYLDSGAGLPAGVYTLLPKRYGLLPGAFMITPKSSSVFQQFTQDDGSTTTTGFFKNAFGTPSEFSSRRSLFQISSPQVIAKRAEYEVLKAGDFIRDAASRLNLSTTQRLPADAGTLSIQGNSGLSLQGSVLAAPAFAGRGAQIDLSSLADIYIKGGSGIAPPTAQVVLDAETISNWGVESLLIGGIRQKSGDTTTAHIRTSSIIVNNPGTALTGKDIILASKAELNLLAFSSIKSIGVMSEASKVIELSGDGSLLRLSRDSSTSIKRTTTTGSTAPKLTLGAGVLLSGSGLILDTSYANSFDTTSQLNVSSLTLNSGQVSVLLQTPSGALSGSVIADHLILGGSLLPFVQSVDSLTLSSYRSIDFYGTGQFGSSSLKNLNLFASSIRGYNRGLTTLEAQNITIGNLAASTFLPDPALPLSGTLQIQANQIALSGGSLSVGGYQDVGFKSTGGLLASATGALSTTGNLKLDVPLIAGAQGISYDFTTTGTLSMPTNTGSPVFGSGLGASLKFTGASIAADTSINLPSGRLELRATSGNLRIGGRLATEASSMAFYDITRYADAGSIILGADLGDVELLPESRISVAGTQSGGNAGELTINSPNGVFINNGQLIGSSTSTVKSGAFTLDAKSITSFSAINSPLQSGGFFESRNIRVRTGSVIVNELARAKSFSLSADAGSITLGGSGFIDASGNTGGAIYLGARDDLTLSNGSKLSVAGLKFSSAGKGGEIRLEAGASSSGIANTAALLDVQAGSSLDLAVTSFVPGAYTTIGSSAFEGKFQGKLFLRAPRSGNDVRVDSLEGTITGASSVLVEAARIYDLTAASGVMNTLLRGTINTDSSVFMNAGELAMRTKLLAGSPDMAGLNPLLIIAPGVEIINRTGDLTLGLANIAGSTNAEAKSTADWDLSTFRYGTRNAPGVLTLRAKGDIVFNNTLSDGFVPVTPGFNNGDSAMWLASLKTIDSALPVNTQSWSYKLTAGADLSAADSRSVLATSSLTAGKGSILVGEFHSAVPNQNTSGNAAAIGSNGQTADSIRIATATGAGSDRGTRYEVVRTGTGDITINAGRDIQLRNQFATIYTAGVALPTPSSVFAAGDFFVPVTPTSESRHPSQSTLGAIQQLYGASWTMAGGQVSLAAAQNIGRYTMFQGSLIADTSRQLPNNWLYRRGYVDSTSGLFASNGGVDGTTGATTISDPSTSTAWWIDFSNFFQGIGALAGGDVVIQAGRDVLNIDAVAPTNARMAGINPVTSTNIAPSASNLLEFGGGDLKITAGRNIDGGVYYAERGSGILSAGGEIKTNQARSLSLGVLNNKGNGPALYEGEEAWMPTMLISGKSQFQVTANSDVLLGPIANTFLLPQGINNRFWYKTYFNTYSADASVSAASLGGSVTLRSKATLAGSGAPISILAGWYDKQHVGASSDTSSAYYQPWLRLAETGVSYFNTAFNLATPSLFSTAFAGDINIVGDLTLFPAPKGTLELAAKGAIRGLQSTGTGSIEVDGVKKNLSVWTSGTINISDADPTQFPSAQTPSAYQAIVGRNLINSRQSAENPFTALNLLVTETGSYTGVATSIDGKQARHSSGILHKEDSTPNRLYATGGSLSGLTLFSPKASRIIAEQDVSDVAFFLQNTDSNDISLLSAGRDIVPYNDGDTTRAAANNISLGNYIADAKKARLDGSTSSALSGDIQINGPGYLEILAGRNLDLGTGANLNDGTGLGITSIGNLRNPFLPFTGASLVVLAGIEGSATKAASGLANSKLNLSSISPTGFDASTELSHLATLSNLFSLLRQGAEEYEESGSYETALKAVESVFGSARASGDIFTRSRDIRTNSGGAITILAPSGALTLASDITGNPLTPPGIVTEYGGEVSIFTDGDVDIGRARIFTLRGGDMTIWSTTGDIAAGSASKTVVTAPPTRVSIDVTSAAVNTDLGGLATGGGIGVLASVEGVEAGDVFLIAPEGVVDAGDAGIQATGNLRIAATQVLNADNIAAGGASVGVPSAPTASAPNVGGLTSGSSSTAAASSAASSVSQQSKPQEKPIDETPSLITVDILGYGGSAEGDGDEEKPVAM